MIALDTEDDSRGNVTLINFYDGIEHQTFTSRLPAWQYLYDRAPETVWACNMEYDLVNLFGPWLGRMVTLQYVGQGLLRGSFRDARILFLDTLRHWPISVKGMGEYLGLPKLKRNSRSVAYVRRDTEIVWRFVSAMLARYDALGLKLHATLPGMALEFFRQVSDPSLWRVNIPKWARRFFREGYYGGRVECYRLGTITGPIYHYDINSLFPFVMATREYPKLDEWGVTDRPTWTREGMVRAVVQVPSSRYPALPMRGDGEMLFPYGTLTGVWTYPEIRQVLADGGRVLRVIEAIEFRETCRPFEAYVTWCYTERRKATHELDRYFWKLMMNTLYGKFGQHDGIEIIYDDEEWALQTDAAHANIVWAAYITAYARLELLQWLRRCRTVYYTDTDSLFVPHPLPTGPELGQLKLEGKYAKVEIAGNKTYVADGQAKAKGVSGAKAALDFVRTGRAVYRRPARWREARRRFLQPNVWYLEEKRRDPVYTKRRVLVSGETVPWEWSEYVSVVGHRWPTGDA